MKGLCQDVVDPLHAAGLDSRCLEIAETPESLTMMAPREEVVTRTLLKRHQ